MVGDWWFAALVLLALQIAISDQQESSVNMCVEKKTCGECATAGPRCGWCTQAGYDKPKENHPRCDLLENLVALGCDMANAVYPEHETTLDQNTPVTDAKDGSEAVQLQPQAMTVKLRPNAPYKFNVTFRQAENYPVDLYFVMDLSYSMADDKVRLAELGKLLAENMADITKNFRLGFGSFVDKKTMPYVSMVPHLLDSPCTDCAAPYGFKNQMRLTDDTPAFRQQVLDAPTSGNLDAPEGGFDAIMQAITCEREIGWRPAARKLLLFSSDDLFHFAGDGLLGGIVLPNDGACHLDTEGYYSESLNQDYPSISQLSHKISEKKVNMIFAVTESQVEMYSSLSEFIEGSVVGELANDSSNIVKLVRDNYQKISSKVELKAEAEEDISVKIRSKCSRGDELRDKPFCDELRIGQTVTFEVEVQVSECPERRKDWRKQIRITPVGLTEELVVNLELNCECPCEQSGQGAANSAVCDSNGTFECGACTCNKGHYGKKCECDGSTLQSEDYNESCRLNNSTLTCEGRGYCQCGECQCNPINSGQPGKLVYRYSGSHCQCNDYNCDYYNEQRCAGPTRGQCVCGKCDCKPGFKGSACECPESDETCRAKNGIMCNGKGTCKCGKCTCNLDTFYRGNTCEDCPTCEGRCTQNKACVQCEVHKSGPLSEEECKANCTHVIQRDSIVDDPQVRKMCRSTDDDECMFYYAYEYNSNIVYAQRTKECPEPVDILAIVLGVVLGIVFIGLALLLIWKLLTTIQDRRELASFEKERKNAKWDTGENPIYKQATSTFKNPTYAGNR